MEACLFEAAIFQCLTSALMGPKTLPADNAGAFCYDLLYDYE